MSFFISITKPKKTFSIEEHLNIFKFIPLKTILFRVCIQCTLEFVFAQWHVREERREKHKQVEVFIGWIACEFFSKYFVLFWISEPKKLLHQLINMSALFRSGSCTQLEGLLFRNLIIVDLKTVNIRSLSLSLNLSSRVTFRFLSWV